MADYGFLRTAGQSTVGDVLREKSGGLPALVHAHPQDTVREAIDILREYHVSQMLVVQAEPPVAMAEVVGSVVERDLLERLFTGQARLTDPLERHMSPPLPVVGAGEPVDAAVTALEKADGAVVLADGRPAGVLTRQDLLTHLAR
jgi:cystathionine beta-synthase